MVEGWLYKSPSKKSGRAPIGRERRRWLVLCGETNLLTWHEAKGTADAKGALTVATIRQMPNTAKSRYGVEFADGSGGTVVARAETLAEQRKWLRACPEVRSAREAQRAAGFESRREIMLLQRFFRNCLRRKRCLSALSRIRRLPHEKMVWVSVTVRGLKALPAPKRGRRLSCGLDDDGGPPMVLVRVGERVGDARTVEVGRFSARGAAEEWGCFTTLGPGVGLRVDVLPGGYKSALKRSLNRAPLAFLDLPDVRDAPGKLTWLPLVPGGLVEIAAHVSAHDGETDPVVAGEATADARLTPEGRIACRVASRAAAAINREIDDGVGSTFRESYDLMVGRILGGERLLRSIAASKGTGFARGPLAPGTWRDGVADVVWYLFARSAARGAAFRSGAWMIEDRGWRLHDALAAFAYCRAFKQAPPGAPDRYDASTFGSSHLVGALALAATTGAFRLPDDGRIIRLADGATASGYYQCGVDVGPLLPARKAHVLFGRAPPKDGAHKDQFLFFKLEEHGNAGVAETLRHGINYAESLRSRRADKGAARTEKVGKKLLVTFTAIVRAAMADASKNRIDPKYDGAPLSAASPAFTLKDFTRRAKALGYSFMHPVVVSIRDSVTESASMSRSDFDELPETDDDEAADDDDVEDDTAASGSSALPPADLLALIHIWMATAFQHAALDHLPRRYAKEIILDHDDLYADDRLFAAEDAPNPVYDD